VERVRGSSPGSDAAHGGRLMDQNSMTGYRGRTHRIDVLWKNTSLVGVDTFTVETQTLR